MKCSNCNTEVSENTKYCPNCGNGLKILPETKDSIIGKDCIVSIVMSLISFILTTIIRFNVDKKTDLTPSALNYNWGMAVPSEIKPFVLAVPIIFTRITIIKTVMSSTMNKKEKVISYIIAAFSLVVSVAIVNWSFDI